MTAICGTDNVSRPSGAAEVTKLFAAGLLGLRFLYVDVVDRMTPPKRLAGIVWRETMAMQLIC